MSSTTAVSLIEPARGVTEDMIRHLVDTFYGPVLQDEELGPISRRALSQRWSEHLAIMVDFWSSPSPSGQGGTKASLRCPQGHGPDGGAL